MEIKVNIKKTRMITFESSEDLQLKLEENIWKLKVEKIKARRK